MHPKTTVINIVTIPHDAVAVTSSHTSHTSQAHTPEVILGGENNTRSRGSGLCSTNICPSLGKDKQALVSPERTRGLGKITVTLPRDTQARWRSAHDSYSHMHMRHQLWSEKAERAGGHAGLIEEPGNWSTCSLLKQASSVIFSTFTLFRD